MSTDVYRELILEHYKHPRNYGKMKDPDVIIYESNPLCGDEIEIHLKMDKGFVKDLKFSGRGCAISQASASLLTDRFKGKPAEEIMRMKNEEVLHILGLDVRKLNPARTQCAVLPLKAIKSAIGKYQEKIKAEAGRHQN